MTTSDDKAAEERAAFLQPTVCALAPRFSKHRLARRKCAPSPYNKGVWLVRNNANEPIGILRKLPSGRFLLIDEFAAVES